MMNSLAHDKISVYSLCLQGFCMRSRASLEANCLLLSSLATLDKLLDLTSACFSICKTGIAVAPTSGLYNKKLDKGKVPA